MEVFTEEEIQKLTVNPFTTHLVENFNSLEDTVTYRCIEFGTLGCSIRRYIQAIKNRYDTLLEQNKDCLPEDDISNWVQRIITIYTRSYPEGDGITLLTILYFYCKNFIIYTRDYSGLHTLFLTPLFTYPLFKHHLQDPLVMRFLFICTIHCNEPNEYDTEIDSRLNTFYLKIRELGRDLYWDFLEDMAERTAIYKEDLIAAVWHPRRVEKWLEAGGFELLEAL
jgi:hypothetical protein